jgi:hypothetical protein
VCPGHPIQNSLLEYHTMLSLVCPSLLGEGRAFTDTFIKPIVRGLFQHCPPVRVPPTHHRTKTYLKLD